MNEQEAREEAMRALTIEGHPNILAHNTEGRTMKIIICAECNAVRSVLYLSKDRWYCTSCRNSGDARPTMIPLSNPARRE